MPTTDGVDRVGADDRDVRVEEMDAASIYCELAVRTDGLADTHGVSVEASWDDNGLYVTLRDIRGDRRSVRLVAASEDPVVDVSRPRGRARRWISPRHKRTGSVESRLTLD